MASDDLIREAQDPSTAPARLQELATTDPATWPHIAANPAAYDGLLEWLGRKGDDSVRAVIAARDAGAPTEVVAPVAETTAGPDDTTPGPDDTVSIDPTPADVEATTQMPSYGSVPPTGGPDDPTPEETPGDGRRRPLVLAGIVAAAIVLVGGVAFGATQVFGGDDDSDSAGPASPTPAATTTGSTPDPTPTPTPSAPATSEAPKAGGDFCDAMQAIQDPGALGSPTDAAGAQDLIKKMSRAFDDLEASAPPEIRSDVKVMGTYIDALSDPTGSGAADLGKNASKYAEAVTNVSTYYASNCL